MQIYGIMLEDEIVVHNQYGSLLREIGYYGSPAAQPDTNQVQTLHFIFFMLRTPSIVFHSTKPAI